MTKNTYKLISLFLLVSTALFGFSNVAKAQDEYLVIRPQWNLITIPYKYTKNNVNFVIGSSLPEGSRIYRFNTKTQEYSEIALMKDSRWVDYYNQSSNSKLSFVPFEAYWIYNSSEIATFELTISGTPVKEGMPKITVKNGDIQMAGTTYKTTKNINDLSFKAVGTSDPESSDSIYIWNYEKQWFESAWFCGGSLCKELGSAYSNKWLNYDYTQSTLTLKPFQGFMYVTPMSSQSVEVETPRL